MTLSHFQQQSLVYHVLQMTLPIKNAFLVDDLERQSLPGAPVSGQKNLSHTTLSDRFEYLKVLKADFLLAQGSKFNQPIFYKLHALKAKPHIVDSIAGSQLKSVCVAHDDV